MIYQNITEKVRRVFDIPALKLPFYKLWKIQNFYEQIGKTKEVLHLFKLLTLKFLAYLPLQVSCYCDQLSPCSRIWFKTKIYNEMIDLAEKLSFFIHIAKVQ